MELGPAISEDRAILIANNVCVCCSIDFALIVHSISTNASIELLGASDQSAIIEGIRRILITIGSNKNKFLEKPENCLK